MGAAVETIKRLFVGVVVTQRISWPILAFFPTILVGLLVGDIRKWFFETIGEPEPTKFSDMIFFMPVYAWLIGLTLASVMVVVFIYAIRLQRRLTPTFLIDYGGVVLVPDHPELFWRGAFMRGTAVALTGLDVEAEASLIGVLKRNPATGIFERQPFPENVPLNWPPGQGDGKYVLKMKLSRSNAKQFDIVAFRASEGRIRATYLHPDNANNVFVEHGVYQIEVLVAASGLEKVMTIEFTWCGDPAKLIGRKVSEREA